MPKKVFLTVLWILPVLTWAACNGALSSSTFDEIQKERIVLIGTVPFEPPLLYQQGQGLVGPEADLAEQIVQQIRDKVGVERIDLKWATRTSRNLVPALKQGEVSLVIAVFGITETRREEVAFSEPYYTSELVLVINPAHADLRPNMLSGKSIGVREGTAIEEFVKERYADADLVPFETLDNAILSLRRGEIQAVIDDRNLAAYSLATLPGASHLEYIPDVLEEIEVAVAVRKQDTQLLDLVNGVVSRINSENLYAQWLQERAGEVIAQVKKRHESRIEAERKAEAPRRLVIRISKDENYDFDIYRMANLSFTLVNQETGKTYTSSRIDFRNRVGISSANIPPGRYRLVLAKFNNWSPGEIPILPSDPSQVDLRIRLKQGTIEVTRSGA